MELAIVKFMCLSALMGVQMVTSSSKVIKKIDSHIAKQGTTTSNPVLQHHPTPTKPKHNESDWMRISSYPSNYAIVKIYSRTGYFLEISSSGKIRGTKNYNSKLARLIVQSFGKSILRFQSQATQKYLAMNAYGVLYSTRTSNDECFFKEKLKESGFHIFSSHKHSGSNKNNQNNELYLAIKKNGKQKHGINTAKTQRAVEFVMLRI